MYSSDFSNLSVEPSALRSLTAQQKEELADIVDQYLSALEAGAPLDKTQLLKEHPELAGPLRTYLDSLEELHEAAAGFANRSEPPAAAETSADSRRLGDFKLIREIGRGGMGVVYEAHQISLDRRVALKVLPFAAVLDSKQIARFKNEAHAAAQLDHPNIVSVFAVGVERGVHYYAMRLVDGQPLDQAVAQLRQHAWEESRVGPKEASGADRTVSEAIVDSLMAEDEVSVPDGRSGSHSSVLAERSADHRDYYRTVIRLGIQAAEALHAAHEFGVIHRDVKPSNLLLDGDGKLWVTDFGLARFQADANLTRTGDVVGTMRYMSPEQAAGKTELLDRRTDIYSLGVTLYELLTLRQAFAGDNPAMLLQRIQHEEPVRPRQIRPQIPRDLETVVLKAMAKKRSERYPSARRFAEDLQRVLDGRPTVAKPPTLPQRLGKWAARRRRFVATCAGIGVLALIGTTVSTILIAREKVEADRNRARAEKSYQDARDVLDRFGRQLADRLAGVPGADDVREDLLRETLRYYRDFAEENKGDPTLEADLASTHSKIGALTGEIGSSDEAVKSHRRSVELLERLVAREPDSGEYRRRLGIYQNNLGAALRRSGRIDEARAAFGEALRIQNGLLDDSPTNEEYLSDLARSQNNVGLLECKTGHAAEAYSAYRQAIAMQEQLLSKSPGDVDRLRELAASLNNLAALQAKSRPEQAERLYRRAVSCQKKAAEGRPRELARQDYVAQTLNNLGTAQMRAGRLPEAVESYSQAIEIHRELVRACPSHDPYRRMLAIGMSNLGEAKGRLNRVEEASRAFDEALQMHETLLKRNPDDLELRSIAGGVYNNWGTVLEKLHRTKEAADSYAKAIEHQRVALDRAPKAVRCREFLSKHLVNYGRVLRELGRRDEAARAALARKSLWPGNPRRLFAVAEELAMAAALGPDARKGEFSSEDCASRAIDALEESVSAGLSLPADLEQRTSFASLRNHQRFVKLIRKP